MNNLEKNRRFTYLALLSAMAITLNILETTLIPAFFGVFRIGLANIISLVTIRIMGVKEMIIVNIMRVVIGNLMTGRIFGSTFWISAGGVLISSIILVIMDKLHTSLMFTSVMSAIGHSAGQVLVVMAFYMQPMIAVILPYFLLISIPTGLFTGFIAKITSDRIKPLRNSKENEKTII
jgi:heptaprenyl diphosphate synthase